MENSHAVSINTLTVYFSIIHFPLFHPSVKLIIRFRRFGFTNPFSGWLGLVAPFGLYAGMVTRLHNIHISSSGL